PLKSKDPVGFTQKAISMEAIQTYSLQLKSKHLLAIFDSCFSGSIFALGRAAPADITYKTALPVRQYITAGNADEIVPDKSLFKECFLEALKGDGDANSDGYVTGSELGMYLESKVVNYSRNAQHPQYGKIRNIKLDKGDFVFVLEKEKTVEKVETQLPPEPPESASVYITSIKKAKEKRESIKSRWESWQARMKSDFTEVEKIDKSTAYTNQDKEIVWRLFLDNYKTDNPYSREDEQLRQRVTQRLKTLSEPDIAVRARVSLRSVAESLSENEVGEMLKRENFFSKRGNLNKNYCNPNGDFTNEYEVKTIRGDKVVLDYATGLIWHQSGSEKYMKYDKAKQWIDELNHRGYAGYSDWRLPTLEEGASLIERRQANNDFYIDPKFSAKQRWIWTGDMFSDSSGLAWIVRFSLGDVSRYGVDSNDFVRPVRSSEEPANRPEEALKRWDDWQNNMNSDFQNVEDIEKKPVSTQGGKKAAWKQFLRNYDGNNPYTTKDEQLRQRAAQRIKELSEPEVKVRARESLRSSAQSLSRNEGESMVKRKNFFDSNWNKSGGFENEYVSMTINRNKVVLDHATGLMWHQSGSEKYMKYDKAKQWIDELNRRGYAGYSDWRLPTLEEGASLIERSKMNSNLYIDPKFSAKQLYIWTGDMFSDSSGRAWVVLFNRGSVRRYGVGIFYYGGYVRPVRSGQ
ncbi:MAG: DUF1566 domain-containing protein, partial [Candidatus Aminicenantaceae bacterium]